MERRLRFTYEGGMAGTRAEVQGEQSRDKYLEEVPVCCGLDKAA